ncbi:metallophosphoesterase [uncultured Desulfosarcina sp.]|uniref:metallophosphoesterase family protein n=1 Tax=uncultured Desulfosarcina sp. TaxID=218289 RepID=UPI0029C9A146|nr:metallophosphoesterase [uncultured Desulfosarcina sp.]
MEKILTRIAHISDLHFTKLETDFNQFEELKEDLIKHEPDLIFVTGDIADNLGSKDHKSSLYHAKNYLELLCRNAGLDPAERLFVIPGNHDYRFKGIKLFGDNPVYADQFKKEYREYYRSRCLLSLKCIVICFDSNTTDDKINLAEGKILRNEFTKSKKELKLFENDFKDEYPNLIKIALLHHHPMPVYLAEGASSAVIGNEKFMILENSATFMREMLKNGVKFVFHGHEHKRGCAIASYPIHSDLKEEVAVISAGSVGQRSKTNDVFSYNLIDLFHSGEAVLRMRILRGEGTYEKDPNVIRIFDANKARFHSFNRSINTMPTYRKSQKTFCRISYPSGDMNIEEYIEELQSLNAIRETVKYSTNSKAGAFITRPKFEVDYPKNQTVDWKIKGNPKQGGQEGYFHFNPPLSEQPISGKVSINLPNAFSFTKEDRIADNNGEYEPEGAGPFIGYAIEKLDLHLVFPDEFKPIDIGVRVIDKDNNVISEEESMCSKSFYYSQDSNIAHLSVDYPKPFSRYSIKWDLPVENAKLANIDVSKIAKSEEIQKRLLSLTPNDFERDSAILKCMKEIYFRVTKDCQFLATDNTDNRMEVCLAVYDTERYKMIYKAYYCPSNQHINDSKIWNISIGNGLPFVGSAKKRNEPIVALFPKTGPSKQMMNYIRPPGCQYSDNEFIKAIIAIPLVYPYNSDNVVCVLELASCSNNSILLGLGDGTKREKMAKRATIKFLAQEVFFPEIICPAIDISI